MPKDAYLAVLAFPSSAAILPLDAYRLGTLLEKAGFIHDEYGVGMAEVLDDVGAQVVTHLVGIPLGRGEQALDAIGARGATVLGDLPAILAFDGTKQRAQVLIRLLARFGAHEVLSNALVQGGQTDRPAANLRRIQVLNNYVFNGFMRSL